MSELISREITIGWTKNTEASRAQGYVSFFDGYREGAAQHEETITVGLPSDWTPEQVADAVFEGTNRQDDCDSNSPAGRIYAAVQATGYRGREAHFSLSVGDTVTLGEVRLACESVGWKAVRACPSL